MRLRFSLLAILNLLLATACPSTQSSNKPNSLDVSFDYGCCYMPSSESGGFINGSSYCAPDCDSCSAAGTNPDNSSCGSFGDPNSWAVGYPSSICQVNNNNVYCASSVNGCSANSADSKSCDKVCYSDCNAGNTKTENDQVVQVSALNGVAYCNADPVMFCPSLIIDNSSGNYSSGTVTGCLCPADID